MAEKDEFVVDSSIVAKWYLVESDSEEAIRLRDLFALGRIRLAVPTLLFYEVVSALRFSCAYKEADLTLAARSLSKYRFRIWRPRGRLLESSAQLSLSEDVTVYDACYVALARRLGSKVVTEDKELLGRFPADTVAMELFEKGAHRTA